MEQQLVLNEKETATSKGREEVVFTQLNEHDLKMNEMKKNAKVRVLEDHLFQMVMGDWELFE